MRKRSHRKVKPVYAPTMIGILNAPESGITERLAVDSFAGGWATVRHFNVLLVASEMLMLGANGKKDEGALEVARQARIVLASIAQRYKTKGRMGCTGDDLQTLRVFLDVSDDFWFRTSGKLYAAASRAIDELRSKQLTVTA